MSTPAKKITTTGYGILGLLALRPWTTYELAKQMDRSLGRLWPRARSKLFQEPKNLVAHGLAEATEERVGRRPRTVYRITRKGRRALAAWLEEPGDPPTLEFEQMLKFFFADQGSKRGALTQLAAMRAWADEERAIHEQTGLAYLEGKGAFQQRAALLALNGRFISDFADFVGRWADWATAIVYGWPEDIRHAPMDPAILEESVRRARRGRR